MLLAVLGLALTTANARESRAFERRAERLPATVVDVRPDEGSWSQHVTVLVDLGERTVLGRAPVLDADVYRPGQSVVVLHEDGRLLLEAERYDAASPALLWAALLVAGSLTIGMGWWWVHRCRRTARSAGPAFAMEAEVREARPRWWNRRRGWVTLFPVHGELPVGAYPLISGVPALSAGTTGTTRHATEVKGNVRDGGLVVARCDGQLMWPRGRLRT